MLRDVRERFGRHIEERARDAGLHAIGQPQGYADRHRAAIGEIAQRGLQAAFPEQAWVEAGSQLGKLDLRSPKLVDGTVQASGSIGRGRGDRWSLGVERSLEPSETRCSAAAQPLLERHPLSVARFHQPASRLLQRHDLRRELGAAVRRCAPPSHSQA